VVIAVMSRRQLMERALSIVIVTSGGCGDNQKICTAVFNASYDPACPAAQVFAARDSAFLVPTSRELESYAGRWARVLEVEPLSLLQSFVPERYRDTALLDHTIHTTNPAVISAWQRQVLSTGDAGFDHVLSQLEPVTIAPYYISGDGLSVFTFTSQVIFGEEQFQTSLANTGSGLSPPGNAGRSDGIWQWKSGTGGSIYDSDTAQIDVRLGWGDCLVGCIYFHKIRFIVPPAGSVDEIDLGGAPFPDGIVLGPAAHP
jgi:hypothetical protein